MNMLLETTSDPDTEKCYLKNKKVLAVKNFLITAGFRWLVVPRFLSSKVKKHNANNLTCCYGAQRNSGEVNALLCNIFFA